MNVDSEYKGIVKVPPGADTGLIIHDAVLMERLDGNNGVLVACDGSMLVAVPCELEDDDVPGLVPVEALARAFKATTRALPRAVLLLRSSTARVPLDGGSEWPRPDGKYPDYHKIVPREPLDRTGGIVTPLSMILLQRAWEAVGKPYIGGYWMQYNRDPGGPVVLHTRAPLPDGAPSLPYACVMPLSTPHWVPRSGAVAHVA